MADVDSFLIAVTTRLMVDGAPTTCSCIESKSDCGYELLMVVGLLFVISRCIIRLLARSHSHHPPRCSHLDRCFASMRVSPLHASLLDTQAPRLHHRSSSTRIQTSQPSNRSVVLSRASGILDRQTHPTQRTQPALARSLRSVLARRYRCADVGRAPSSPSVKIGRAHV